MPNCRLENLVSQLARECRDFSLIATLLKSTCACTCCMHPQRWSWRQSRYQFLQPFGTPLQWQGLLATVHVTPVDQMVESVASQLIAQRCMTLMRAWLTFSGPTRSLGGSFWKRSFSSTRRRRETLVRPFVWVNHFEFSWRCPT